MLKNLLVLPDGTKLFSGNPTGNAIKSVTLTQCVNSEVELTLGSTCANMLEATLITPNGGLSLTAGDEVVLLKVDDKNTYKKVGVFILEQPTRPTAHTMKLTGYDRVTKLDKDLTEWLKGLDGWPYNILNFASMVCKACGLTFIQTDVPNKNFTVEKFTKAGVTGRQIMKWIGEVCCRFCRANADGNIEMGWYEPLTTHAIGYKAGAIFRLSATGDGDMLLEGVDVHSGTDTQGNVTVESEHLTVKDDGQGHVFLTVQDLNTLVYFQNGLSYEDYTVAPVGAVQIQLAEGEDAYRWPEAPEGANCYVISGNPMLSSTTDVVSGALQTICEQLADFTYTPCKVSLPAVLDIQPGHVVRIVDKNEKSITMFVMSKKTTGQKDTYECTGSHRRDSTTTRNNQSVGVVAQQKVDAQTQGDIFRKLTNGGKAQGIFLKDGQLYINASYLAAGVITSADGKLQIDLSGETVPVFNTGVSTNGLTVRGDAVNAPELISMSAQNVDGKYTAVFLMRDVEGKPFFRITEDVGGTGGGMALESNDEKLNARVQATDESAGFLLSHDGTTKAYLGITSGGFSAMECDTVNPGKTTLFTGAVSEGGTCSVPNTSYYDLFAVRLGDDSNSFQTVVLAYKVGSVIRGIGGWCGTETEQKQIFFLSATFSGDTWTIVQAGVHNVPFAGGVSSGTRLQVKQIRGII